VVVGIKNLRSSDVFSSYFFSDERIMYCPASKGKTKTANLPLIYRQTTANLPLVCLK
jgi:hypothetical protein